MTRDELKGLGERIAEAALDHVEGVPQVRAQSDTRGLGVRSTHVGLHVRVGDWSITSAATIDGHDREAATARVLRVMRTRLTERLRMHEAHAAACRVALGVLP